MVDKRKGEADSPCPRAASYFVNYPCNHLEQFAITGNIRLLQVNIYFINFAKYFRDDTCPNFSNINMKSIETLYIENSS